MLCDPEYPIPLIRTFIARVVVYDLPFGAITKGEHIVVHSYTSKAAAKIQYLLSIVDQNSGEVLKQKPK